MKNSTRKRVSAVFIDILGFYLLEMPVMEKTIEKRGNETIEKYIPPASPRLHAVSYIGPLFIGVGGKPHFIFRYIVGK